MSVAPNLHVNVYDELSRDKDCGAVCGLIIEAIDPFFHTTDVNFGTIGIAHQQFYQGIKRLTK